MWGGKNDLGRSNKETPANDLGLRVSGFHFGKIQFNYEITLPKYTR
jgi:hypothetical protein